MRILTQPPQLDGVPESLRPLVAAALAKEPEDRPSAAGLLAGLMAGDTPRDAIPIATAVADEGERPRPRRSRVVAATAVALAVLLAVAGGLVLRSREADRIVVGRSSVFGSPPPANGPSSAAASADPYASVPGAGRRTLIHVAEIDHDLSLDRHWYEVTASDGGGVDALFVLQPAGVDFVIRSLRSTGHPQDKPTCVGVKLIPDDNGAWLQATECRRSPATLFSLRSTGDKDDEGRPTFYIYNDAYGYAMWNAKHKKVSVDQTDALDPGTSFSFVDRGPVQ
jgi:hypothetical protein